MDSLVPDRKVPLDPSRQFFPDCELESVVNPKGEYRTNKGAASFLDNFFLIANLNL